MSSHGYILLEFIDTETLTESILIANATATIASCTVTPAKDTTTIAAKRIAHDDRDPFTPPQ